MLRALHLILLSLMLAACATAPPPSAPTALPTPVVEISTLAPTDAALPADTPAPPTPVPSPPTPTITPTPPVLNPLTGLPVDDAAVLNRRPLAIKVAHFPRRVRAYQVGLSFADQVWEHYAEGGVTRFTAIFLSQSPEKVGNVRSARLLDAILGDAYHALLVASGSSSGTLQRLRENEDLYRRVVAEATGYSECPLLCREESAALTTDKLFTSPGALWALAETKGLGGGQVLEGFVFEAQPPANGLPATTIHIDFQRDNTVAEWRYDAAAGRYARWIDTASLPALDPHLDMLNGQQLAAANVVVLYVTHVTSNIHEEEDGQRYFSYDILMTGGGPARVFRNGLMYDAMWARTETGLPRFLDAAGNVIPFQPGSTWFEVLSTDSPTEFAEGVFYARFKAPDPFPETPTPAP